MAGSDVRQDGQAAGGPPGQDPCAPLRLVAAAAWQVVRARQVPDFPRVLGLLEAVGRAAPDLVRFRHYSRLRLGLQAAVIMHMLREGRPDGTIYEAVDTCFPEGEPQPHPLASARDLRLVGEAQETFRELVLGLLSDPERRAAYVEEQLEAEYGEPFLGGLQELFFEYLGRLDSTLPPPQLQQLQEAAWRECPQARPPQPPTELSVLAQYLADMGHPKPLAPPLVSSTPSVPQPGAGPPAPWAPGSHEKWSQEGPTTPPGCGLPCPSPKEQDPDPSVDVVWESDEEESCPRRKVPWRLRSRDPARLPPPHGTDTPTTRGRPTKPFIADTK